MSNCIRVQNYRLVEEQIISGKTILTKSASVLILYVISAEIAYLPWLWPNAAKTSAGVTTRQARVRESLQKYTLYIIQCQCLRSVFINRPANLSLNNF